MKPMKLHIDRDSFAKLKKGKSVNFALALNDLVSTTRHDPEMRQHTYETRLSLVKAGIKKTDGALAVLTLDDRAKKPVAAIVTNACDIGGDGLRFRVTIAPRG